MKCLLAKSKLTISVQLCAQFTCRLFLILNLTWLSALTITNGSTSQSLACKQCSPFLSTIVLSMEVDIVEYEHKELREEIFAQVACHISVTFTSQNNSRLPLAPTSASSSCLSHALCVDSEGNPLKKHLRQSYRG